MVWPFDADTPLVVTARGRVKRIWFSQRKSPAGLGQGFGRKITVDQKLKPILNPTATALLPVKVAAVVPGGKEASVVEALPISI